MPKKSGPRWRASLNGSNIIPPPSGGAKGSKSRRPTRKCDSLNINNVIQS